MCAANCLRKCVDKTTEEAPPEHVHSTSMRAQLHMAFSVAFDADDVFQLACKRVFWEFCYLWLSPTFEVCTRLA